ncbi:endonuclease-reverse transcriptase [Lasius niger]|uniref:Endonuclease-reverse transcriptase n=1 Tax=Lasius niger TaxID=67767 RepID=A0A0J7KKK0_LASNI|nr:endonuclease-reverse transcriptase [Lasius niger]
MVNELEDVLETWRDYCAKLYKQERIKEEINIAEEIVHKPEVIMSEVENALKSLKRNKSPRADGISSELLLRLGERRRHLLEDLCNEIEIWESGTWPED